MLLKLAWRNIWRNTTRTAITITVVALAVVLSAFMMSLKKGVYKSMIENMVGNHVGFIQIHVSGYWNNPMVDNGFVLNPYWLDSIKQASEIEAITQRLEGFALAVSHNNTKGTLVLGVDVQEELKHTHLNKRVVSGDYFLSENANGVLLGEGLAEYLKLHVKDSIVLIGQGYHGASAAGKYPIIGIVKIGSPEMSKQLVVMPVNLAYSYFDADSVCTSLVLKLHDNDAAEKTAFQLQNKLGNAYEVMAWQQLLPELVNMIKTDEMEGYVFMFILYMVISFGIFGTVLMMLSERQREFGVLISIGMKRIQLAITVWCEIVMMTLLGAIIGILLAYGVCLYIYHNPIKLSDSLSDMMEDYGMDAVIQTSVELGVFTQQAGLVFVIATLIAAYPWIHIYRLKLIDAMHR